MTWSVLPSTPLTVTFCDPAASVSSVVVFFWKGTLVVTVSVLTSMRSTVTFRPSVTGVVGAGYTTSFGRRTIFCSSSIASTVVAVEEMTVAFFEPSVSVTFFGVTASTARP